MNQAMKLLAIVDKAHTSQYEFWIKGIRFLININNTAVIKAHKLNSPQM